MAGLIDFCKFFITTCVDQVDFMAGLLEPEELLRRMEIWTEEETRAKRLSKGFWPLLREAVMAGEYARGAAPALTGYEERQAPTVLNALIEKGYSVSPTTRSPVKLGFPTAQIVSTGWLASLKYILEIRVLQRKRRKQSCSNSRIASLAIPNQAPVYGQGVETGRESPKVVILW